jgi:hypothetical protein
MHPVPRHQPFDEEPDMFNFIQRAALAAAVVVTGMAAAPLAAQADASRLSIQAESVQYRGDRYDRHRPRGRECTPNRAVEKAWKLGLNRPRVSRVNRNTIVVRGFQRGQSLRVVFARAPNCPVIR